MSQSNISSVLSPLSIEDEVITSSTSSQAQHQRLIRVHFHTSDPSSVRDFAKDEILYSHRVTSLTSPSVSKAVDDLPSTTTKCGIVYTSDASLPLECVDSWKSRCILRSTKKKNGEEEEEEEEEEKHDEMNDKAFKDACKYAKNNVNSFSDKNKLKMYGLYKQATEGRVVFEREKIQACYSIQHINQLTLSYTGTATKTSGTEIKE